MKELTEIKLRQIGAVVIISILAGLLLYFYIYDQGFTEGKKDGYGDGYGELEDKIVNSVETNETFSLDWKDIRCEEIDFNLNFTLSGLGGYWTF